MKGFPIFLFLAFLCPAVQASPCAGGSTHPADTLDLHTGILEIQCPVAGVIVFADSQLLGTTPLGPKTLTEGRRIITYVPPDAGRWLSTPVIDTLVIRAGDRIHRTIDFPPVVHITTEPYGATVRRRDGLVAGSTPLDLRLLSKSDFITVDREGYDEATVPLADSAFQVDVLLHPRKGDSADPQALFLAGEHSKSSLPITISTGAAVLSGAAAAYFKIRADNYYNDYKLTGNQGSLAQVRNLDLASGISLAASELSFFALAYFLLSR